MTAGLEALNQMHHAAAEAQLLTWCGSDAWATAVCGERPFRNLAMLQEIAERIWFALPEPDWLQAFACHPRIGEKKPDNSEYLAHSSAEQAAAQATLNPVAEALLAGNRTYEERFGFRYIVFASGRSAPELLAVLQERLTHTREQELLEAARQQHRITCLRMAKWLHPEAD